SQVTSGFYRCDRQRGNTYAGKAEQLLQGAGHRKETDWLGDPIEIMLSLLLQIIRLDECGPSIGWEMLAQVPRVSGGLIFNRGSRVGFRRWGGYFQFGHIAQTSLGLRRELSDRFDFVAEELQAAGRIGIRGEDIQDSSAATELSGQGDDFGPSK